MTNDVDVVVIGGGSAGLSGALTLARARWSVLVLDAGEPRNAPAAAAHGWLTRDGVPPLELLRLGRAEIEGYGGRIERARAVRARRDRDAFVITTDGGAETTARRVLLTTGLVDELPDVPGLREHWGRDVVHCPFCHGWEIRDQRIGVLGTGPHSVHQAMLFRQWSEHVSLLRHTSPDPTDEQWEQLAARGVEVIDGAVERVLGTDRLTGVQLVGGTRIGLDALAVGPRFVARADLLADLGLEVVEHPSGVAVHVAADPSGASAVPGVWVAGNVADPMANVVQSAAAGFTAASRITADLVMADAADAVAARRESLPVA